MSANMSSVDTKKEIVQIIKLLRIVGNKSAEMGKHSNVLWDTYNTTESGDSERNKQKQEVTDNNSIFDDYWNSQMKKAIKLGTINANELQLEHLKAKNNQLIQEQIKLQEENASLDSSCVSIRKRLQELNENGDSLKKSKYQDNSVEIAFQEPGDAEGGLGMFEEFEKHFSSAQ
jgi:hypothetical protein